jgi:asparagine synthase (glutamine-hydrolysing)
MRAVGGPGLELHAFSYVADDPSLSEERWVEEAARASGATVHVARSSAADLVRDLDRLIEIQHEPFASTSIYAQHRVFDLVSRTGIKVVLDGQGADELLGGYTVFVGARIASLVRRGRIDRAVRLASHARRHPGHERAHLQAGQFLIPRGVQRPFRALVGRAAMPAWLNAAWLDAGGLETPTVRGQRGDGVLRSELSKSVSTSLLALLRYEDRNSMAYSIESRVPFLTPSLATLLLSLPEEYVIGDDGTTKRVFRAAMRGIVPDAVLDRRDKIGFQTPERAWMKMLEPWAERVLTSDLARSIPVFNHSAMMAAWRAGLESPRRYHAWTWRWINLVRWTELAGVSY